MGRYLFAAMVVLLTLGAMHTSTQQGNGGEVLARIRAEGLQRSRALPMYRTLTDEIGARLTGSPAHGRAGNGGGGLLMEGGLTNPHLEPYEFGRGWELEHISVEMTQPRYFPFIAYGEAWTPSTKGGVSGRAGYVGGQKAFQ